MFLAGNSTEWIIPVAMDLALPIGLLLLILGFLTRKPLYLFIAGLMVIPFVSFLAMNPGWQWVWLMPILLLTFGGVTHAKARATK